jgi:hypothetical protein
MLHYYVDRDFYITADVNAINGKLEGKFRETTKDPNEWTFTAAPKNGKLLFQTSTVSFSLSGPSDPMNEFDWMKVGGTYSTYAGVLAGFVFLGIIEVLKCQPRNDNERARKTRLLTSLLLTFVGFLLTAFLLGQITGYPSNPEGPEPVSLQVIEGVVASMLALGVVLLFLSLAQLVHFYEVPDPVVSVSRGLSFVMSTVAFSLALPPIMEARTISSGNYNVNNDNWQMAVVLVCLVVGLILHGRVAKVFRKWHVAVMWGVFGTFIAATALYFLMAVAAPEDINSFVLNIGRWLVIGVLGAATVICSSFVPFRNESEEEWRTPEPAKNGGIGRQHER